jgi:hypothetical protein
MKRRLGIIAGGTVVFVLGMAACSLGLDESRIGAARDGGGLLEDGGTLDGEATDGGGNDSGIPVGPDASACANDNDCTTNQGCLKGKCDLSRKSCVYEVCRPSACNAGACNTATRTCAPPAAYKYKAAQFSLGAQLSCARCVAAVHPWLFATTATGVVAFNVSNPGSATPPQVPVVGLGFVPTALVQSGSRVWMVGDQDGPGPSRLQLAYIDSPADPFVTKIEAKTVLATYSRPAEATKLFARGGDSALLVGQNAQVPAAFIEAPLQEPLSITATPLLIPQNFNFGASVSGKRLLSVAVVNQVASFTFVENAGSASPATGPAIDLTDAGAVSTQQTFAQSPDGAILWVTGAHQGSPTPTSTRAARAFFLVPGDQGAIVGNAAVDVEVYLPDAVAPNAPIFGPNMATAAMLDAKTAIVAVQARENDQQTSVQFVRRDPLGLVPEGAGPSPRRLVLPVPIGSFTAAAGSNGIGYLVANDQAGPPATSTVYVFDPACAP